MRLLSFCDQGRRSFGAAVPARAEPVRFGRLAGDDAARWAVVDLGAVLSGDLRTLLADPDGLARAADALAGRDADLALDELALLPPVPAPEKIICIGVNYARRNAEYQDDSAQPRYPSVFMRVPDSLTGHGRPLWRPPESEQLDYEGELAIVIGRAGRRIAPEQAGAHIAGLTLMNEGSVRDWLRHGKFNVTQGKNFVNSGACGPWLVTADEVADYDDLIIETRVNGELRQHDNTANLMFPFAYLVSYLSTFFSLRPGDVIATGTPNGAGARFDPPRYLSAGDVVEVSSPSVGTLRNAVIDEPSP